MHLFFVACANHPVTNPLRSLDGEPGVRVEPSPELAELLVRDSVLLEELLLGARELFGVHAERRVLW